MNIGRVAIAAVVATVVDAVYGFLVYGTLLNSEFARHPAVYRPASDASYMPILFLGVFVAALAAAYMYAKGYEGGSPAGEGLRFGALLGTFALGYAGIVNYAVLNIDTSLGARLGIAAFVEWLIAGLVIGLAYRGATVRKAARV
jgi:hypothetical protein